VAVDADRSGGGVGFGHESGTKYWDTGECIRDGCTNIIIGSSLPFFSCVLVDEQMFAPPAFVDFTMYSSSAAA
jgi:hypothetical protein